MDGIIRVRALERSRHRLVHGERKRVLLVGPVHPDGADAVGIGDNQMLGHEVYPILSLHRPQPGSSITVVVGPGAPALLAALSFVRGIYSDSVIRRRLD